MIFARNLFPNSTSHWYLPLLILSGSKSPLKFGDIDPEILKGVDYVVEEFHDVVSEYPGSSVIKIGQGWENKNH